MVPCCNMVASVVAVITMNAVEIANHVMAKEGLRFTEHYSGSTVCAPARNSFLTGQHTGHTQVRGNPGEFGEPVPLRPQDVTIAEILRKGGYITAIIGKWGLGEPGTTGVPNRQGFDYFFGYLNLTRLDGK